MLKSLRKKKKLTQKNLADLCGLSQNYISELENYPAKTNPTVDTLILLSIALNIDSCTLFKYFVNKKLEHNGKLW